MLRLLKAQRMGQLFCGIRKNSSQQFLASWNWFSVTGENTNRSDPILTRSYLNGVRCCNLKVRYVSVRGKVTFQKFRISYTVYRALQMILYPMGELNVWIDNGLLPLKQTNHLDRQ